MADGSPQTSRARREGRGPWVQRHLFMVVVAIVCGLLGAAGAIGFRYLIRLFETILFAGPAAVAEGLTSGDDLVDIALALPWWARILIPATGGLLVGPLVHFLAREAKGHGVPEVMEAVALRGGTIRPRVVAVKSLASALTIGSGGSVGREGPIVQIGSAVGSSIGQIFRLPPRQLRTVVGCGAAAGIAATFNAPIAGALFAVEIILADFAVAQFSPIVISSVVATVVSRSFLGDFPAFEVPAYELVSPFELVPYMGVGIVAGVVSWGFVQILYRTEDLWDAIRIPEWTKASVGGAMVGSVGAIGLPHVFGVGYGSINAALTGELAVPMLVTLLAVKLVATSITVGSGGSGGVFAPSLFMGAMLGGLFGTFVHQWFPDATATSGSYALVTMGAVVAATTHAPITAIIMIFELTSNYTIIPALMAACVVSTLVATLLGRDSIYTRKLHRRGVDIGKEEDPNVLRSLFVRDVIDHDPDVIPEAADFQTILDLIVQSDHTEFFVVDGERKLLGAIYLRELRRLIFEMDALRSLVVATDLLETDRPTVGPDDDLALLMQIFSHGTHEEIAVIDANGVLIGSVHKRDVIEAYNDAVLSRDLAGGVSRGMRSLSRVQEVELGGGLVLQEILAPARFFGRSLRELDLARKTGVHVVLIRRFEVAEHGKPGIHVPHSEDRIDMGDKLVVAGRREDVHALDLI